VSVMNPPVPQNLDIGGNDTFPSLSEHQFGYAVEGLSDYIPPGDHDPYEDVALWIFEYKYVVPISLHA
jgi:hypothetical protein